MNKPQYCTLLTAVILLSYISGCDQNNNETIGDAANNLIAPIPLKTSALVDIAGSTERISIDTAGLESNANSISSSINDDGQYVVFNSLANNLVANDNNDTWDIFLRDRVAGETIRINQSNAGQESNADSQKPKISGDGSYVVYVSAASNLIDTDNNALTDIFLYDVRLKLTQRISIGNAGVETDADSSAPNISYDGRFVVFESNASNLTSSTIPVDGPKQIYVYDAFTGTIELVSISSTGELANGDCLQASISDDGQIISFSSTASNLATNDNNNASDVFVHFRRTGVTTRVSVDAAGNEGNGESRSAAISGDGQHVAFLSAASNLVVNDSNNNNDIFVYDLHSANIERVSVADNGVEANSNSFNEPDISADGQVVVFYSTANNLSSIDDNSAWDVFVRDRALGSTQLISINSQGVLGNGSSFVPAISPSANYVAFGSQASNLVLDDNNNVWDIFVHVRVTPNQAPIANAGSDQDIYLGQNANLDGSLSYDPDALESAPGPVADYHWAILSAPTGSQAKLSDSGIINPQLTPDIAGQYVISLIVNDGSLDSIPDEVIINVSNNLSPKAIILADLTQGETPLTVSFDGSTSTDPEGEMLSYQWNFDDPQSGDKNISSKVVDTHSFALPGVYNVVLSVTDAFGNTGEAASIRINVTAANQAPVVLPNADKLTGPKPLSVSFFANASDPDGDVLTYLWDFGDGATSDRENPRHTFNNIGANFVKLIVSDGSLSTSAEIIVIVDKQLELDVLHAKLNFEHDQKVDGKIHFKAKIDFKGKPKSTDRVTVLFDNITLIDVAFSAFRNKGDKKFKYQSKGKHLVLDLKKGRISVVVHGLMLHDLNYCNGVDVFVGLGNVSGLDQIYMLEKFERSHDESNNSDSEYENEDEQFTNCDGQSVHEMKLIYKNNGKIDGNDE